MEIYKLDQSKFKDFKKQILLKTIPLVIIAGGAGIAMVEYNSTDGKEFSFDALLISLPIMILAIWYGINSSLKRQKKAFESFEIRIDSDSIERKQKDWPNILIRFDEIKEIVKYSNGSLGIKGNSKMNMIGISEHVENREALEIALTKIQPIKDVNSSAFATQIRKFSPLLGIAAMIVVFVSRNKFLVGISGTALVALMVYVIVLSQNSKNVDDHTKKRIWILIFVILSIIASMYYKLSAL